MKKLITAIAAIATSFGLFAADDLGWTSVLSDIQSKTNNLVVGYDTTGATMLDDTGDVTVNWFADSLKTDFTTKMETYEQPELKVGEDEEGSYQYLAIDTDVGDPVLRTFKNVVEDTGDDNFKYNNIEISQHGVFIDTWTTFTLFDDGPMKDAPGDSKILVWALETDPEETDPKKLYGAAPGSTNLMVTCGWYEESSGETLPTNYVLAVNGIVPEQMYRLTIRADKDGDNNTKFRVYLDGEQLKTVQLEDGTTLEVFPSLVGGNQQLGAAGFGGTGSLKGIDLLTEMDAPEKVPFAIDDTYLTVTWTKGVVGFIVGTNRIDVTPIEVEGETDSTNLVVEAGDTVVTPIFQEEPVPYKLAEEGGYLLDGKTVSPTEDGKASFTIERYDNPELVINAVIDRIGASFVINWSSGGSTDMGAFPYLKDVFAKIKDMTAENPDTPNPGELGYEDEVVITLVNDETEDTFGFDPDIAPVIILDLNGHTMSSTEKSTEDYVIDSYTLLTICDNSETGGGKIVAAADGQGLILNKLLLTLDTVGEGAAKIKYEGRIENDTQSGELDKIVVNDGLYTVKVVSEPVVLPEGKVWSEEPLDGYYYLTEPGTVALSLKAGAHNSITSEPAASSVKPDDPVTVTVTPDVGYQFASTPDGWDEGANGTIVSNFTITADTAIIAPDATAIPYAITYKDGDSTLDLSPKTYTIAAAVDLPALPAKAGYTAAGWYGNAQFEGDTITTIAAGETGAKTFYVKYTADTYKYTFAKAGSEVGEPIAPIEYTIEAPATITAPACTWTLADHEFAGWTNTVKGGSVIAAGATLEKVLENTELTATWVSTAAPEPTPVDPEEGDIKKDDNGNFVITPAKEGAEITVQNAGDNNFIVESDVDFTIKGVAADKIKVMCNGEDITSVCKGGNATDGFSTELDPAQTTPVLIEASATEQPLVVGTTVDLKIKQSVPGLAYKLLRVGEVGDFSDSAKITPVATQKGDGETLTLTDANKPANKAFYKVAVGKDVINESAD